MGIIDIASMPTVNTPIAIDTNVLVYIFYSKNSTKLFARKYSDFFAQLIEQNTEVLIAAFNICELFHVIEKIEMGVYNKTSNRNLTLKGYRGTPGALAFIQKEINLIYDQIKEISQITILDSLIYDSSIAGYVQGLTKHACDFFDFALLSYCNSNGIAILSHDSDFGTPEFTNNLYTANPKILPRIVV